MRTIALPDMNYCRAKGLVVTPAAALPLLLEPASASVIAAPADARILVAEIDNVAAGIAAVFNESPFSVQSHCIKLAHALATLRLKTAGL